MFYFFYKKSLTLSICIKGGCGCLRQEHISFILFCEIFMASMTLKKHSKNQ